MRRCAGLTFFAGGSGEPAMTVEDSTGAFHIRPAAAFGDAIGCCQSDGISLRISGGGTWFIATLSESDSGSVSLSVPELITVRRCRASNLRLGHREEIQASLAKEIRSVLHILQLGLSKALLPYASPELSELCVEVVRLESWPFDATVMLLLIRARLDCTRDGVREDL